MRHGSLFSGIGGFDLAAEWMGWENVFHCEWNKFGQQVLHYYWPKAICYENICTTDFRVHRGTIEILTGGFPCQPFSSAGLRRGKEDERHLWPEMLRAIREIQPRWIVGENVRGLTNWNGGVVFDEVQSDLEAQGYEVTPFLLPACAVNAPTVGTEFGLLPTPTSIQRDHPERVEALKATGAKDIYSRNNGENRPNSIIDYMNFHGMLPTPTAMDSTNATATMKSTQVKEGSMHSVTLTRAMAMGMLPTPTAQLIKHGHTEKYWDNRIGKRQMDLSMWNAETNGKTSQLSPQFVLEMMGFPVDWTLLPFLNGEMSQSKQEETQ